MGTRDKASSKKAGKRSARRFGWQDQQEALSKSQFAERLAQLGWNRGALEKDLGEDFLVQIYDDGVSSGLSFYVQLKSIRDAELKKGKKSPNVLRYPLEVKDIEHWEVQAPPVVLVVWDVEKRQGYWETIPRIIEELDKAGKAWRKKDTVRVSVPVENGTDDGGMRRLRGMLADLHITPVINRLATPYTFRFPNTDEGRSAFASFQKALDDGDEMVFNEGGVVEIERPTWLVRLYGDSRRPTSLTVKPNPVPLTLTVRIDVQSSSGRISIPYVELRVVKQGKKHLTLTNEHQNRPIIFVLSGNEDTGGELELRFVRFGRTIQEARETVAFYSAMEQACSRICVYFEDDGRKLFDCPAPLGKTPGLEDLRDALEKLAFIEPYISKYGSIAIGEGISTEDQTHIAILYEACKNGQTIIREPFRMTVGPTMELTIDNPSIVEKARWKIPLLGIDIPVGRVRRTIQDSARVAAAIREALVEARVTKMPVPVHVGDVESIVEFLDWPPPHDRLFDLASTQSGYFTLAQAFEAGFNSAEQLQIQERIELIADGVYRIHHYPPSDHEDLVVTWLQTEKQGIFSHDTALALHELSDILPVRQHITVPPGWKPIEGMRLSPNTVLHYGTVGEKERAWMGPVPFTKPLRTLVDCIDKGLTPDLVIQGIEDARRRGMISREEAERLRLANLKTA